MSTNKSNSPQLINIVILRSFAIIAVVLYHCFCPWLFAWNWTECQMRPFYSYFLECVLVGRMPLFICVSGYLFSYLLNERSKYQEFSNFLLNKTKRLLLPCVLFSFIMSITFKSNPLYDLFYTPYHLWFLKMLFLCFLLTWILGKYVKGKYQIIFLVLSLGFMILPNIKFFSLGQFFKYYFFFYEGFLFCKYRKKISPYIDSKTALLVHLSVYTIMCLIVAYLYYMNQSLINDDIIHINKPIAAIRILMRFYTVIVGFSIVDYIIINHQSYEGVLFKKLNNLSYGIYLLHIYFLNVLHDHFFYVFELANNAIGLVCPLVLFIIVFSISIFFTWLFKLTKFGRYIL